MNLIMMNLHLSQSTITMTQAIVLQNLLMIHHWMKQRVQAQMYQNQLKKRGRKNFMTSRLASALDNAKVSDGMAVHILIAAAEALGHRVEELVINRSSIHRLRQENRSQESKKISTGFIDNVIYS